MTTKILIISATIFLSQSLLRAQQTLTESVIHDGLVREYIVYVPAIYEGTSAVPLMFNFHGYTGQANGHMIATEMRTVADSAGFILVYPQGALFLGNTHWNVGAWTSGSTTDDLGFTETMIDLLSTKFNIDLKRVYSCGYSNGGYFSYELACQLSNRIAAIGSVGGKMSAETFNSCNPLHPTPVVSIHGTEDNVVSYFGPQPAGSKTVNEVNKYWASYNNSEATPIIENIPNLNTSDGSTVEFYTYINGNNCVSVDHYKVIGGGHDWPGAWGNKDINSSSIIWDFVSKYDINGLISCTTTSISRSVDQNAEMIVIPNPSKEFVKVKIDLPESTVCYIYSLAGTLILSKNIGPGSKTIDISALPANIYLLQVGSKTLKLIKAE